MATQICLNCRSDSFTWSIDETESHLTKWACECGYIAFEDESFEQVCAQCDKKREMRLEDEEKIFWWCSSCNTTKLIR